MGRRLLSFLPWVIVIGGLPIAASAQTSIDDRCRNATGGLVLGMQTHLEIGSSRELALQRARAGVDEQELQQPVFRHCESLSTSAREELNVEFYVP